jgi:hypothetical protein
VVSDQPAVEASPATIFLFVLQAGLGRPGGTTAGGLYGIATVATLSGLLSGHALNRLKDVFGIAFASKAASDTQAFDTSVKDTGVNSTGTTVPSAAPSGGSMPTGTT